MTLALRPLNKCPRCSRWCHLAAISGGWRFYCGNEKHRRPFADLTDRQAWKVEAGGEL